MRKSFLLFCSLWLAACLIPSRALACNSSPGFPANTTHILAISPQAGIAGVTQVWIDGYCFGTTYGDGQNTGYVTFTVNGTATRVPAASISVWTDAEIVFTLPFTVQTGDLTVYSASYGSDDSATEANCLDGNWCGNDEIDASFTVFSPDSPSFSGLVLGSPPSPPQYVTGTWLYSDGVYPDTTYNLSQGTENLTNDTWPITGDAENSECGDEPVTGTLDQYGDLVLSIQNCGTPQGEWQLLGSGDVTSQGIPILCGLPQFPAQSSQSFADSFSGYESAEGQGSVCQIPPLFKSANDQPASEIPSPQGWSNCGGTSAYKTCDQWQRALPQSPDGHIEFGGRFVYEQSGGAAADGCYFTNSNYAAVTSVTSGGGWYVDTSDDWGKDTIGAINTFDSYYQDHYGPMGETCQITGPQAMYIDTRTGPSVSPYTTNTLMPAKITPTELLTGVQPQGGSMVTECENYSDKGVGKGKCK